MHAWGVPSSHFPRCHQSLSLGIQDFGYLRKEIEVLAVRKPAKLLAALKDYDAGPAQALMDKGGPVSFG